MKAYAEQGKRLLTVLLALVLVLAVMPQSASAVSEPLLVGVDSMETMGYMFDKSDVVSDGEGNLTLYVDAASTGRDSISFKNIVFEIQNVPEGATVKGRFVWLLGGTTEARNYPIAAMTPKGGDLYLNAYLNNTILMSESAIDNNLGIFELSIDGVVFSKLTISYTDHPPVKTHTVMFDINGGTIISPIAPIAVNHGETIKKPTSSPGFVNHIFVGWYDENGNEFDFSTQITKDITLKAKWLPRAFASSASGNVIRQGDTVTLTVHSCEYCNADDVKIYYSLGGAWTEYTEPVAINAFPYNYDDGSGVLFRLYVETRAYGKTNNTGFVYGELFYEAAKYTVTFDSDGGSETASATVYGGDKVSRPANPVRDGYTFSGWYMDESRFDFDTAITGNTILVAKWTENEPEVTLTGVVSTAVLEKLQGSQNRLTITVTGHYSDGSTATLAKETFLVSNNAAGTYDVGGYSVYVETKGNTQIRACYIAD